VRISQRAHHSAISLRKRGSWVQESHIAKTDNISRSMETQYVPSDIRDFILKHIASVAQIEALLLIWSNPEKRWNVSHIAARIYAKEAETATAIEGLCAQGLLIRKDDAFALNTSEENVEMVGRLKEAYARHLIPVTDVIHSKSRDPRPTADTRGLRDR
jgi:hypothetical protein